MFTPLLDKFQSSGSGLSANHGRKGNTPFHKQLRWLIQNPPETSVVLTIDPAMAEEFMRLNKSDTYQNRPESKGAIARYARAMGQEWKLTGETIIVSKSGNLLNGQHRLLACVASGRSFRVHVVFGIDDDAFAFMDIGKKRTAGDIFSINGVPNAIACAAAIQWVWRYENSGMMMPSSSSFPTHDRLYDYYLQHKSIDDSFGAGHRFSVYKVAPPSLMMALHYLCSQKNQALADIFFKKAATGVGFTRAREPAAALRKRLMDDRIGGTQTQDIYVAAFTVLSWNAIRENKPSVLFRWRGEQNPEQSFPRIV